MEQGRRNCPTRLLQDQCGATAGEPALAARQREQRSSLVSSLVSGADRGSGGGGVRSGRLCHGGARAIVEKFIAVGFNIGVDGVAITRLTIHSSDLQRQETSRGSCCSVVHVRSCWSGRAKIVLKKFFRNEDLDLLSVSWCASSQDIVLSFESRRAPTFLCHPISPISPHQRHFFLPGLFLVDS